MREGKKEKREGEKVVGAPKYNKSQSQGD